MLKFLTSKVFKYGSLIVVGLLLVHVLARIALGLSALLTAGRSLTSFEVFTTHLIIAILLAAAINIVHSILTERRIKLASNTP